MKKYLTHAVAVGSAAFAMQAPAEAAPKHTAHAQPACYTRIYDDGMATRCRSFAGGVLRREVLTQVHNTTTTHPEDNRVDVLTVRSKTIRRYDRYGDMVVKCFKRVSQHLDVSPILPKLAMVPAPPLRPIQAGSCMPLEQQPPHELEVGTPPLETV